METRALGSESRYRLGLIGSLGVLFIAFSAIDSPCLGNGLFATNISQSQALEYGRAADENLQKLYTINSDPKSNAWVQRIGRRLIPASDQPDMPCEFRILDDPSLNAFSVPGYIYISSGLLDLISADPNRDAELAGVIAHELGHIDGRHVVKEIEQQENPVFSALAGMVTKGKCSLSTDLGGDLYLLGHDDSDEIDADRRAVDTLVRAGIDPNGLASLYRKLLAGSSGKSGDSIYQETHPDLPQRLGRLQQRIADDRAHGAPAVTVTSAG